MRPLWMEFPIDKAAFNNDEAFMVGNSILVQGVYSEVIALNSSQKAEGELYLDDGKTFDFQCDAYIHRRFIFSDGKLISLNKVPSGIDRRLFSPGCVVERIIILGLTSRHKTALIGPANKEAEIEMGPLLVHRPQTTSVLTVRKSNVRISDDWTIQIL